jgi:hypothetical protein
MIFLHFFRKEGGNLKKHLKELNSMVEVKSLKVFHLKAPLIKNSKIKMMIQPLLTMYLMKEMIQMMIIFYRRENTRYSKNADHHHQIIKLLNIC